MRETIKPITLYYCGKEKCEVGHFFGPAIRPHYLIHFVLSGKGIYKVDEKTYPIKAGQAFLIRPQEITFYKADDKEPWVYAWIAFDGIEAEKILDSYHLLKEKYVCDLEENTALQSYLEKIVKVFENSSHRDLELLGYFYLIFSTLKKEILEPVGGYDKGYLKKAKDYMRQNYSYPIAISDVSRYVGIERTYLYKIFIHHEGISPKKYLTQYRLLVAKDLLLNTAYNITEIAFSSGFHDSSVFCKHFKKEEQMTPMQYRTRNS